MERHQQTVSVIAFHVGTYFKDKTAYRIFHGSSNSTRPRPTGNVIDISILNKVIEVNPGKRTVLVEPNVPMDRLVEATLAHGLIPPVVMEFPGITAGGGYSGSSGESSSFRQGFFNDTINYVEMILGNGEIVMVSPTEHDELFYGAAGAAGTLGITTLMEVRLIEAKPFVKTTYYRTTTISESVSLTQRKAQEQTTDYLDGILFSKNHGVIVTGEMTNQLPDNCMLRTFSKADDPWFYMHVEERTKGLASGCVCVEYIPIGEYLFRYDRAGFWVGRQGYTYFKYIPFNAFFRWLLDDFSHTRTLYHALHASGVSNQFMVQDLALPYDTAEQFINHVDNELCIWPLWLCPLRGASTPTFHPVTGIESTPKDGGSVVSQAMLNIGVWGWGPLEYEEFVAKNRQLEAKLVELGGRKWLYAHTYYSEDEFWQVYNQPWYQALRSKYHASTLPSVFDKVRIDVNKERRQRKEWASAWSRTWPLGGLYGMWLALRSGDIGLARRSQWKYVA
ncbi:galactose-1-phosphate uridylyltransferase [Cordyceps fumosorosea ARSEF 2679]|uniref:Delta(24)-sterol reductase n=1 Tax=Cordyceps fumosorosea (strain ARSEF 2679) TaxID=1081104 RepID=A0A167HJG4_CORFA|nr:galactose-1-phosphate uridylyltransferase [Cordyceps fumosorosea ARSEF 2679]OAA47984.1 galactose-1-phosphate uridylyltransferase [Cordyceps fumosorosea ARSEF 2679]